MNPADVVANTIRNNFETEANHLYEIPGLGVVESITITNEDMDEIDVHAIMNELIITQNIYDCFIQGTLVLTALDGVLESQKILLNGQETLSLKVRSSTSYSDAGEIEKGNLLEGSFVIYSVKKDRVTSIGQVVTMKFISKEFFKNRYTKISKWFEPQRKSEMIKKIYDNYLKDDKELEDIDETEDTDFTCVIPNWNPHQSIRWLLRQSTSSDDDNCKKYVFYESWEKEGGDTSKFYLKAWTNLNNQAPVVTYSHQPLFLDGDDVFKTQHRNIEFSKPLELDTEKVIQNGSFASKLVMHDLFRKKLIQENFSYKDEANPTKWPKPFLNEQKKNIISSADANTSAEIKVLHTNRYSYKTTETVEGNEK